MLSAENAALCYRDKSILGLKSILQPEEMLYAIKNHGFPHAKEVKLDYLRYKPLRRCIGLFHVEWGELTSHVKSMMVATAMNEEGWSKFCATRAVNAIAQGGILLPDIRTSLEWFPNDHGLKNVAKLLNRTSCSKVTRRILKADHLESVQIDTLAYKPARRHVACVSTKEKKLCTLKTYTNRGFLDADWRIRFAIESKLADFRLLNCNEHYSSIATSWIEGETLIQRLRSQPVESTILARAGSDLASWHESSKLCLDRFPGNNNSRAMDTSLSELAEDIGVLAPSLSSRAKCIAGEIASRLAHLPWSIDLIHGDFYAKQVILDPVMDTLHFIDFDQIKVGDRYEDVGNFVAKNVWQEVHEGMNDNSYASLNQEFLDGYSSRFGLFDEERLRVHVAAAIFRCAPHAFRRGLDDWTQCTERLLDRADDWLRTRSNAKRNLESHTTNSSFGDSISRFTDPCQLHLAMSHESSHVPSWLRESRLTSAQIIRHKPQRRLLVEYGYVNTDLDCQSVKVIGKARLAKNMDAQTPSLQEALLEYDWGDSELRVPRVFGRLPTLSMWLQEFVEADRIYPGLRSTALVDEESRHARVGRAIADFHRSSIRINRVHTVSDELGKLNRLFSDVGEARPELTQSLLQIESYCQRLAERLPDLNVLPIHRDFYFDQVLVSNEHVYLLDLDLASMGPAELDVGNYLAHLDEFGIRFPSDKDRCKELGNHFLEGYLARSEKGCERSIEIWRKLALARHIAISTRISDRSHTTRDLLDTMLA